MEDSAAEKSIKTVDIQTPAQLGKVINLSVWVHKLYGQQLHIADIQVFPVMPAIIRGQEVCFEKLNGLLLSVVSC